MNFKAVIFDFDGTLVRSHEQVYEVLVELSKEYGLQLPSPDKLRELSTRETLATLGLRFWQIPRFTRLARKKLGGKLQAMQFEPGILDALRELKIKNVKMALVTSNSFENVEALLRRHEAPQVFNEMICGSSMLGKHRHLRKALKILKVEPAQALYIGDETRDIEAAKKAGISSAAVSWGFHSKANLLLVNPDLFIDEPSDLKKIWLIK